MTQSKEEIAKKLFEKLIVVGRYCSCVGCKDDFNQQYRSLDFEAIGLMLTEYSAGMFTEVKARKIAEDIENWIADNALKDDGKVFRNDIDPNSRSMVTYGELHKLFAIISIVEDEQSKGKV